MANDIQSLVKQMLSNDSLKALGKQSGVSATDVESILKNVLPDLLNGASQQASQKTTAASFLEAITNHGANDTSNLASFFNKADADDGSKIIAHLLGGNTEDITKKAAKKTGLDTGSVVKVLAFAAPLLMSLLGKQAKDNKKDDNDLGDVVGALLGKNSLAGLLGSSLLGGGKTSKKDDGLDLGDVASLIGNVLK